MERLEVYAILLKKLRFFHLLFLMLATLLLSLSAVLAEQAQEEGEPLPKLIVNMNEYPPFANLLPGDAAEGPWVDAVRRYLDQTSLDYEIFIVPWQRAYHDVNTKNNVLIAHLDRTNERENNYHWLMPVVSFTYSLIGRDEAEYKNLTPEQALSGNYTVVCTKASAHCKILKEFGFKREQIWEYTDYDGLYIRDLVINKRADFLLEDFKRIERRQEIHGKFAIPLIQLFDVKSITSYLAAGKNIHPEILKELLAVKVKEDN